MVCSPHGHVYLSVVLHPDEHVGGSDGVGVGLLAVNEECVWLPYFLCEEPIHGEGRAAKVCLIEAQPGVVPHLAHVQLHGVLLGGTCASDMRSRHA